MSASDTSTAILSPGEAFAQAFARDGARAEVHFDFTITDAFKPTQDRPRLTVRNLFKERPVSADVTRYWQETRPPRTRRRPSTRRAAPRGDVQGRHGRGALYPISAWVRIPRAGRTTPKAWPCSSTTGCWSAWRPPRTRP